MLQTMYHDVYEICTKPGQQSGPGASTPDVTLQAFAYLVDVLCSFCMLPEICRILVFFQHLLETKDIATFVVSEPACLDLRLLEDSGCVVQSALLYIPTTFPTQVLRDPVMALGQVTRQASLGRDFFFLRRDQRGEARASVYEAELLLFLQRLHWVERIDWQPNDAQQTVVQQFPQGIKSAPAGLLYPTPAYPLASRFPHIN